MTDEIKLMLGQHIGKVSKPVVGIGDHVKKGQLVAMCDGLGVNIHSSVYGIVTDIDTETIVIKCDAVQPDEYVKIAEVPDNLAAIKAAGVAGAGGAGFPAHVKFDVDLEGGCVILNAAECEPGLYHNMRVLEDDAGLVVRGLRYIMCMTNAARGIVAIKPKNTAALAAVGKACKDIADVEIKYLTDMYPAGDERVVVREVLGIELAAGRLPVAVGAVVSNVETVKRVAEAIELKKPVITKDFTVGGRLVGTFGTQPRVFLEQPIGTPIKKYIDECGGYVAPRGEIVLGGPFMGARGDEDDVVTKTMGGIFVATPFPDIAKNFGILACECGAEEARLREIVAGMGGKVVAETKCKRMVEVGGRHRCEAPGKCPGQAEAAMWLKKQGAEAILAGACED